MVVATVILLLACAAVSNCVGPDIYSDSGNPGKTCHVHWNYDRANKTKGSFCWDTFAPRCDGERQSPINIETKKVTHKSFSPSYKNETITLTGTIGIVERAPKFFINRNKSSYNLYGVPFHSDKKFALIQFHMHFHKVKGKGSEHRINCNGHDGELHFVHQEIQSRNVAEPSNNNAGTRNTNVVVLAVFVKRVENNKTNPGLDPFFGNLTNAVQCKNSSEFTVGPLEFLKNLGALYRYEGSLTTPTCDETVIWLIRDNPVNVSETDFQKLFNLTWDSKNISNNANVRPPFPMNDRKVFANFNVPNGRNNENHKGNNNDENNGQKCTEWYESRQCSTDHDDDDDDD